VIEIKEPLSH